MSYKTEKAARRAGEAAAKRMKVGDWSVRVWENLGWHASIRWGYFSISLQYVGSRFMLLVGHGGTGISDFRAYHGDDPNELVQQAIPECIERLKYYTDVADWLRALQGPTICSK